MSGKDISLYEAEKMSDDNLGMYMDLIRNAADDLMVELEESDIERLAKDLKGTVGSWVKEGGGGEKSKLFSGLNGGSFRELYSTGDKERMAPIHQYFVERHSTGADPDEFLAGLIEAGNDSGKLNDFIISTYGGGIDPDIDEEGMEEYSEGHPLNEYVKDIYRLLGNIDPDPTVPKFDPKIHTEIDASKEAEDLVGSSSPEDDSFLEDEEDSSENAEDSEEEEDDNTDSDERLKDKKKGSADCVSDETMKTIVAALSDMRF